MYVETSAADLDSVEQAFGLVTEKVLRMIDEGVIDPSSEVG